MDASSSLRSCDRGGGHVSVVIATARSVELANSTSPPVPSYFCCRSERSCSISSDGGNPRNMHSSRSTSTSVLASSPPTWRTRATTSVAEEMSMTVPCVVGGECNTNWVKNQRIGMVAPPNIHINITGYVCVDSVWLKTLVLQ